MADPRLQGASPTPCVGDGDCPASLVCYGPDVSWTNNSSYCLCSTWYGWVLSSAPPSCDLEIRAKLSIAFFVILAFLYVIRLGYVLVDLRILWVTNTWRQKHAITWTLLCSLAWVLSNFLRMIFLCFEFGIPDAQTLMPFGPDWKYSSYGIYQTRPLLAASTILSIMIDYSLILVWYSIADKSFRLSQKTTIKERVLSFVVGCFEVGFIIGASILVATQKLTNFLYFSIPFLIIAVLGYAFAGYLLTSIMNDFSSKNKDNSGFQTMKIVGRRIKLTAFGNASMILLGIVYSFLFGYYNDIFKEAGYMPAGLHNCGAAITAVQIHIITHFLHLTVSSRKTRTHTDTFNSKSGGDSKVKVLSVKMADSGVGTETSPRVASERVQNVVTGQQ